MHYSKFAFVQADTLLDGLMFNGSVNLGATVINVYLQRLDDGDETLSNVSSSSITSSSMLSSVWPTVVLVLVLAANFCILPARPLIVRVAEF
jgi:hypothetical protein